MFWIYFLSGIVVGIIFSNNCPSSNRKDGFFFNASIFLGDCENHRIGVFHWSFIIKYYLMRDELQFVIKGKISQVTFASQSQRSKEGDRNKFAIKVFF